jgi:hypothetical protein
MRSAPLFVSSVVAVLTLTGCVGNLPSSTPTPTASVPGPIPTQARETGLTKPAQVFGGDCAALFTNEELAEIFGAPITPRPVAAAFDYRPFAIEEHGGIRCGWFSADRDLSITVVALPEPSLGYLSPRGCDEIVGEMQVKICALETVAAGIRLSGMFLPKQDSGTATWLEEQSALLSLFSERAKQAAAVPAPIPALGAWAYPIDCEAVVAAGDFSAVSGVGTAVIGTSTFGQEGLYIPPAEVALWGGFDWPVCEINGATPDGTGVHVDFEAYGGARWMESAIKASTGATPTAVEGLDSVIATPAVDGYTKIDVFDGPNWLTFTVKPGQDAGQIATQLVAALKVTAAQ